MPMFPTYCRAPTNSGASTNIVANSGGQKITFIGFVNYPRSNHHHQATVYKQVKQCSYVFMGESTFVSAPSNYPGVLSAKLRINILPVI